MDARRAYPEEVITPFIQLQPRPVSDPLPMELTFQGQLHTAQPSLIELLIENPNSAAITGVHLRLPQHRIEQRLSLVKGYDKVAVKLEFLPVPGSHESEEIFWEITGEAGGQSCYFEGSAVLPVRRVHPETRWMTFLGIYREWKSLQTKRFVITARYAFTKTWSGRRD